MKSFSEEKHKEQKTPAVQGQEMVGKEYAGRSAGGLVRYLM